MTVDSRSISFGPYAFTLSPPKPKRPRLGRDCAWFSGADYWPGIWRR